MPLPESWRGSGTRRIPPGRREAQQGTGTGLSGGENPPLGGQVSRELVPHHQLRRCTVTERPPVLSQLMLSYSQIRTWVPLPGHS